MGMIKEREGRKKIKQFVFFFLFFIIDMLDGIVMDGSEWTDLSG